MGDNSIPRRSLYKDRRCIRLPSNTEVVESVHTASRDIQCPYGRHLVCVLSFILLDLEKVGALLQNIVSFFSHGRSHFSSFRDEGLTRMKRPFVVAILAVIAAVHSVCPQIKCRGDMKPVCGSNGNSYTNCTIISASCKLEEETGKKIEFAYNGYCKPSATCEDMCRFLKVRREPVCGSDGYTYDNCTLKIASCELNEKTGETIQFAYNGRCKRLESTNAPTTSVPALTLASGSSSAGSTSSSASSTSSSASSASSSSSFGSNSTSVDIPQSDAPGVVSLTAASIGFVLGAVMIAF
jgi:hypothetical protein